MDLEHMLMNYTTSESLTKTLSFWYDTERKQVRISKSCHNSKTSNK